MMLTASQQKYLQVIDILEQEQRVVRQIDIAVYLGYSRASVCRAIKRLEAKGLLLQREHAIRLNASGKALGRYLNAVRIRMQEALSAYGFHEGLDAVTALQLPICFQKELMRNASHIPAASGIIKQRK
ncbi:MarR family transcriptional regulator [[Clostridium] innocuum]|nr:MarR family transcriptional regulator [Erysipelotrichaceae bacterium]MCR0382518.1 MarR family transcriptional regulator [[Clostridium] innocuum]MCR0411907.1 MarR family transcriptional regulator [[Clostridium] innocuum]MCR0534858.1 MarR family transcriptional regulator [[Clostridium] innocuum]MCR0537528.1 MarR family transcriptional regulator [[Clostridium] innocuum]